MSEQIDWSKAPEGATHWELESYGASAGWMRNDGGEWFFLSSEGRWLKHIISNVSAVRMANMIARPSTPSWSGEGLPPVGVECEYQRNDVAYRQAWVAVTPRYIGKSLAVFTHSASGGEFSEMTDSCVFRPIRTPEQIAADEREAAIKRACSDIEKQVEGFNVQLSYSVAIRATIEAMIDAGYRKP